MTTDIDDRLREMVLGGSAYQARELAHALDLAEWAELLDLLLDHWHKFGDFFYPQHTDEELQRLAEHDARLMLSSTIGACFSLQYNAVRLCRHVMLRNPDIRARVIAEAAP